MKKLWMIVPAVLLLCLLAGCGSGDAPPTQADPQPTQAQELLTGVLYADFSCGSAQAEQIRKYPFEYTGGEKTPEELAGELSLLTGLDFTITATQASDGWTVDWSAGSTLTAGLDQREQKEDFFFHDAVTLQWFMLDSLWRTLTENLNTENIYYTMDGGKELTLPDLSPVQVFPKDVPYLGSGFYYAHSQEQEDPDAFAGTRGLWRLKGEHGTASIEMDGLGGFTLYYASGAIEATGYLECVDEYGDGSLRYDMYTLEGEWIAGFYFDSDVQLHFGNQNADIYLLDLQGDPGDGGIGNGYVDRWFLFADLAFESLTIQEDSTWEIHNRADSGTSGRETVCAGYSGMGEDGSLFLYENSGREVGFATLAQDELTLVLTMEFEWIFSEYLSGDLVFSREDACVSYEFQEPSGLPEPPVLISGWRFTGLEQIDADNAYNGGYLYRDRTADTLTIITNCCIATDRTEESLEEYILQIIRKITGKEPDGLQWEENVEYSQRLTYPVYILSWKTGANEDTRGCDAFFFLTDTHTYLYIFDTTLDNQLEMQDTWQEVFAQLTLG